MLFKEEDIQIVLEKTNRCWVGVSFVTDHEKERIIVLAVGDDDDQKDLNKDLMKKGKERLISLNKAIQEGTVEDALHSDDSFLESFDE